MVMAVMFALFLRISDNHYLNLKDEEPMAIDLYKIYLQKLKYII